MTPDQGIAESATIRFIDDKIEQLKQYFEEGTVRIYDEEAIERITHYTEYQLRAADIELYTKNLAKLEEMKLQIQWIYFLWLRNCLTLITILQL